MTVIITSRIHVKLLLYDLWNKLNITKHFHKLIFMFESGDDTNQ